ncbi:hypothetical protein BKA62DRAFT_741578 [Auriculariales sp. MPI-PUGE-AT-0066]|nr:hypothetical protein BKA62DRAFT_741578 [Auriculariales sp. MPI-PUGE-AT-0066]
MSGIVGDDIGTLSISPTSRDVVVATRKGLFLIDLDDPLKLPRFLPQGGAWEAAEVQWNPHLSHAEYVVSTSSEKMLLWNLNTRATTSIVAKFERAHYRAVTDVNWHTIIPELVASCALDSWIHVWDIRASMKPVASLSPFIASATQVKWSPFDEHLLATAHYSSLMVWDRRKGSVPLMTVKAHDAKIYGISWSRVRRNEILTCSLDSRVKIWDVSSRVEQFTSGLNANAVPSLGSDSFDILPSRVAQTRYPVQRARALPFADGFLTMPQRGENVLELWSHQHGLHEPVHTFHGQGDVAEEFVWRTRANPSATMPEGSVQLITWGRDRTLRFIPVDSGITEKLGLSRDNLPSPSVVPYTSYANVDVFGPEVKPILSQPSELNPILNAVRTRRPSDFVGPVQLNLDKSLQTTDSTSKNAPGLLAGNHTNDSQRPGTQGPMMSLGDASAGPGRRSKRDRRHQRELKQDDWTRVVAGRTVNQNGTPRSILSPENGSGPASGQASPKDSVKSTRASSPTNPHYGSRGRNAQSNASALADEIVEAMESVKPEKFETAQLDTNDRRWILGLTGPWGDHGANIYIRVIFLFPATYPEESGVHPKVLFEKHPLISLKRRVWMISQLDIRRQRDRPVASCLRFLLGLPDEHAKGPGPDSLSTKLRNLVSETDVDDGDDPDAEKGVVQNTQETPVLRISQATFGPNGTLVCIFPMQQAGGRKVPMLRLGTRSRNPTEDGPGTTAMMSALKLLRDRSNMPDPDGELSEDSASMHNYDALSALRAVSATPSQTDFALHPFIAPHRVRVIIKDFSEMIHHGSGLDRTLATQYSLAVQDPVTMCRRNAPIARRYRRYDHERVWRTLLTVVGKTVKPKDLEADNQDKHGSSPIQWGQNPLARKVLDQFYNEFLEKRDLQQLAMLAVVMLDTNHLRKTTAINTSATPEMPVQSMNAPQHSPGTPDYFNRPLSQRTRKISDLQSPGGGSSSKGSWSSLSFLPFLGHQTTPNPSPPKQLSQSAENSHPRKALSTPSTLLSAAIPSSPFASSLALPTIPTRKPLALPTTLATIPSAGGRPWSQAASKPIAPSKGPGKKQIIFGFGPDRDSEHYVQNRTSDALLEHSFVRQLVAHVRAYAEILERWGLTTQRAAILKHIPAEHRLPWEIAVDKGLEDAVHCSICRLPVNGLSYTCLYCLHVFHYKCRTTTKGEVCPAGCGCWCQV